MSTPFANLAELRSILANLPAEDADARGAAQARNGQLTKPVGALGQLEALAVWYGAWRGTDRPSIAEPQIIIFAGNHGVTEQGVSAFPAEVTQQMVFNFQHGGAAINQLARTFGAVLDVHALDLERPTMDFTKGPAMSEEEGIAAFLTGWNAVDPNADLLITGEMGIGNTTCAAAMAHALFGGAPEDWVGRGTGVDDHGMQNKVRVVAQGVARMGSKDGLDVLFSLGGREIAAMAGAILRARILRIPVLLDGFICCAAAACLQAVNAVALDHTWASHVSAEAAHARLLECLGKPALLSLGMRLGEGSGAALAIGILQGAVACHSGMATFAEAGVSDGEA